MENTFHVLINQETKNYLTMFKDLYKDDFQSHFNDKSWQDSSNFIFLSHPMKGICSNVF